MVFRRDNKGGEAFQRQISQLRQQLGGAADAQDLADDEVPIEEGAYGSGGYSPGYDTQEAQYRGYQPTYDHDESAVEDIYEPAPTSIPVADASVTVVSNDTTWKGEVASEGSMHIHGRYDGVIRAREDVFVLDEAIVSAEVHARNVVVAGKYDGEVSCESRFEVLPNGRVQGAVRSPELVVHDGAVINGSIQMTNLDSARPAPASLVSRRAAANAERS